MFLKPGLIALFMNNSNYNNREYGSIIKNGASYDNSMCVFQVMTENISAIDINVTFIADNGNNTVPIDAASLYNCRQATLPLSQAIFTNCTVRCFTSMATCITKLCYLQPRI